MMMTLRIYLFSLVVLSRTCCAMKYLWSCGCWPAWPSCYPTPAAPEPLEHLLDEATVVKSNPGPDAPEPIFVDAKQPRPGQRATMPSSLGKRTCRAYSERTRNGKKDPVYNLPLDSQKRLVNEITRLILSGDGDLGCEKGGSKHVFSSGADRPRAAEGISKLRISLKEQGPQKFRTCLERVEDERQEKLRAAREKSLSRCEGFPETMPGDYAVHQATAGQPGLQLNHDLPPSEPDIFNCPPAAQCLSSPYPPLDPYLSSLTLDTDPESARDGFWESLRRKSIDLSR